MAKKNFFRFQNIYLPCVAMKTRIEVQKNQIFAGIEEYLLMIDLYTDLTSPSIISSFFFL